MQSGYFSMHRRTLLFYLIAGHLSFFNSPSLVFAAQTGQDSDWNLSNSEWKDRLDES